MSKCRSISVDSLAARTLPFPSFSDKEAVEAYFKSIPTAMRQYVDVKSALGNDFTFRAMHKVYSIILMEKSPKEFRTVNDSYIHRRKATFDTGIYKQEAGLHEDIFICLDNFRSIVHNITKNSNILEAWMTFLSAIEPPKIHSLIEAFPDFASIYQEITDFVKEPKELMSMFSKELYMMDKNLERLMVEEAQEEARLAKEEAARDVATAREAIASVKAEFKDIIAARNAVVAELNNAMSERNNAIIERDIFKLSCKNKTSEEIAEELQLPIEYINSVINE